MPHFLRTDRGGCCVGPREGLLSAAEAMAPLAGRIEEGQAATALSSAFEALANLAPTLKPAAELLRGLTAMSQTEVSTLLCFLPYLSFLEENVERNELLTERWHHLQH